MSSIYCSRCGAPNIHDAAFCSKCGARIAQVPAETIRAPQVTAIPQAHPAPAAAPAPAAVAVLRSPTGSTTSKSGSQVQSPTNIKRALAVGGLLTVIVLSALSMFGALSPSHAAASANMIAQNSEQEAIQERNNLRSSPSNYLEISNFEKHNKGIFNSYSQLSGLTILNRSHFAVTALRGEVAWIDNTGAKFGSTIFQLIGSVPAGSTVSFSKELGTLTSSTIQGNGQSGVVRFTSLKVVETP